MTLSSHVNVTGVNPSRVYYKDGMPYVIDERACLPLELPEVAKFLPTETGEPPLGHATKWAWDTANKCVVENEKIDNVTVFPGTEYHAGIRRLFRILSALHGPAQS